MRTVPRRHHCVLPSSRRPTNTRDVSNTVPAGQKGHHQFIQPSVLPPEQEGIHARHSRRGHHYAQVERPSRKGRRDYDRAFAWLDNKRECRVIAMLRVQLFVRTKQQLSGGRHRRPGGAVGLSADGDLGQDCCGGLTASTNHGMGRTSWMSNTPISTDANRIFTRETNEPESCYSV